MNTKTVIILSLIGLTIAIPQERIRNIFEKSHDPQKSFLQVFGALSSELQAGLPFRNLFSKPREGATEIKKTQTKIETHNLFQKPVDAQKLAVLRSNDQEVHPKPLSVLELRQFFGKFNEASRRKNE